MFAYPEAGSARFAFRLCRYRHFDAKHDNRVYVVAVRRDGERPEGAIPMAYRPRTFLLPHNGHAIQRLLLKAGDWKGEIIPLRCGPG